MKNAPWQPPQDIDRECIALCQAINRFPGLHTTESCCGHGERPYLMFFRPDSFDAMLPLLYYIDKCHIGVEGNWIVRAYTDCAADQSRFVLEGPVGDVAYRDSVTIAEALKTWKPAEKETEERTEPLSILRHLAEAASSVCSLSDFFIQQPDKWRPEAWRIAFNRLRTETELAWAYIEHRPAPAPKPIRICLDGGVIHDIMDIPPGLTVKVFDYDTEGIEAERLSRDKAGDKCLITDWTAKEGE